MQRGPSFTSDVEPGPRPHGSRGWERRGEGSERPLSRRPGPRSASRPWGEINTAVRLYLLDQHDLTGFWSG
jgi:hypothetical protein